MSLKCDEIQDRFSALWENELAPSEEAEVRAHLEICPECGPEFARFDKTLRLVHSSEELDVPEGFLSGVYEKLEDRKRRPYSGQNRAERLRLPSQWRVPVKALAMVAVVFLAFYLTKTSSDQSIRMKEERKKEASLSDKKGIAGEVRRSGPEKEKLDGAAVRQAPASQPATRTQPKEKQRDPGWTYDSMESKQEDKAAFEQSGAGTLAKPDHVATGLPAPILPETVQRKKDPLSSLRGTVSNLSPSQEFVLKTSDRGKAASDLNGLARKFGGKIQSAEGNVFVLSFQRSSFRDVKKELEEMGARLNDEVMAGSKRRPNTRITGSEAKSEETEERDQERPSSTVGEPLATVRIILLDQ